MVEDSSNVRRIQPGCLTFCFSFVSSVFSVVNFFSFLNAQQWVMYRLKQVVFSTAAIARGMPKKCGTTEDTENTE